MLLKSCRGAAVQWLAGSCVLAALIAFTQGTSAKPPEESGEAASELDRMQLRLPPNSPEEALSELRVARGFRVELAAAEPETNDPIAICFDESGHLYTCEMGDYPYPPSQPPTGCIRQLTDSDGDGRYETSKLFVDGIPWPSGIVPWKGGVFVASAPDIWYFKDLDRDGCADERRKIVTGFGTRQSYAVLNNLQWGLDNRIYGATSYNGGVAKVADGQESTPVNLSGRDFRYDPVSNKLDAVSGNGEYGNTFDDFGRRFVCNATEVIMFPVLPDSYLARNPALAAESAVQNISEVGHFGRVYPISHPDPWKLARKALWSRFINSTASMNAERFPAEELSPQGFVTSSAGVTIYRGDAFPQAFRGNSFTAEPANNLAVRLILQPNGTSFRATRPNSEQCEFLASTNNWFRPVNFANGPDGCLYVVDMCREVIEDWDAIPEEILNRINVNSGRDRGRIFRIVPESFQRRQLPPLADASNSQLTSQLGSRNGWTRDTAQRLLVERHAIDSQDQLHDLVKHSPEPETRVHAAWTLEGLNRLDAATLIEMLGDPNAAVREHAVQLSESRLQATLELLKKVAEMSDDSDPRVRLQVAFSLGEVDTPESTRALVKLVQRDAADNTCRTAVLSSVPTRAADLLVDLSADSNFVSLPDASSLLASLAEAAGATGNNVQIGKALTILTQHDNDREVDLRIALLLGLANGLNRCNLSLAAAIDNIDAPTSDVQREVATLFAATREIAKDPSTADEKRLRAVCLLRHSLEEADADLLASFLSPAESPTLQLTALQSLASMRIPSVGSIIVSNWSVLSPNLKREAIEALMRDRVRTEQLLDAIEQEQIPTSDIDRSRLQLLCDHPDPHVQTRARQIIDLSLDRSRQSIIDEYQQALTIQGDAGRGELVYANNCKTCHPYGNTGSRVGPDLSTIRGWSLDAILNAVIDPNRDVKPEYRNYVLVTSDGKVLTGLLSSESATAVTLRRAEGAQDVVLRTQIDELTSTGISLMPEGLEKSVGVQQMADLLSFLTHDAAAAAPGGDK